MSTLRVTPCRMSVRSTPLTTVPPTVNVYGPELRATTTTAGLAVFRVTLTLLPANKVFSSRMAAETAVVQSGPFTAEASMVRVWLLRTDAVQGTSAILGHLYKRTIA